MIQIFGNIVELTNGRKLYDITPKIKDWINAEEVNTGLLTINIKHTSASLLVNENYDSLTNQIIGLTSGKDEKARFNFWNFLSGALAEMIGAFIGAGFAVWLFYSRIKNDKEKERKLTNFLQTLISKYNAPPAQV